MSDTWIVLVEDRHADVEALPFSSEVQALQVAQAEAEGNAREPGDVHEVVLTPQVMHDGWCLLLEYGTEGDRVRVVKREVDAERA